MSEMAKTFTFVAIAAVSLMMAFVVTKDIDQFDMESLVGERLNEFEVDAPTSLKIVKFDNETAQAREFEVASNDGVWTIPSKQDYPADAAQQMAEAATCLIGREVLRVAAKDASQHQELGVVDPSSSSLDSKAEGVGTRVTMTDINDNTLTDMIIGKAVDDAEDQHYVRDIEQDVVFVVSLNSEKLSTRFEDWIEDDLLKLNPLDIRNVYIKDYSAEMQNVFNPGTGRIEMQVGWDRRGEIALSYDDTDSKWNADSLLEYNHEKKELVPYSLAEDEELNTQELTDLRNGLDDLLLVDVERKPEGLSADLKAGEGFLDNQEAIKNLVSRGFAPISLNPDSEAEILSSEGEIICTLKDGVEYVLRFGNLKVDSESQASEEEAEGGNSGIHRYLFVMARFNEDMLEKPTLEELPALPEDAAEESSEAPAEETEEAATEQPSEETTTDETQENAESADTESEEASAEESAEVDNAEEPQSSEADEEQPAKETSEDTAAEEVPSAENAAEETNETGEAEESNNEENEEAEEEQSKDLETIIAERISIEEENQRKLDEYQESIDTAKERVKELNERFGDWYYVISNDVYKKIHLSREQLIKKKDAEEEAPAAGATGLPAGGIPGLPGIPGGN